MRTLAMLLAGAFCASACAGSGATSQPGPTVSAVATPHADLVEPHADSGARHAKRAAR
jgi:hypothetical protein